MKVSQLEKKLSEIEESTHHKRMMVLHKSLYNYVTRLNRIVANLIKGGDDKNLEELAIPIESLLEKYEGLTKKVRKFTFTEYVSLRDSGKTHTEIIETLKRDYGIEDPKIIKSINGYVLAYGRLKKKPSIKKDYTLNVDIRNVLWEQGQSCI